MIYSFRCREAQSMQEHHQPSAEEKDMMQPIDKSSVNRRQFLKQTGSLAAGAAPAPLVTPCLCPAAGQ